MWRSVVVAAVVSALLVGCRGKKHPTPWVEVTSPGYCSHNVLVSYKLHHKKSTACIKAYYSSTGGRTWAPATEGTGGDGTVNLAASRSGVSHVFAWDSLADVDGTNVNVMFRIVPYDGRKRGTPVDVGPFVVNNATNSAPQVLILDSLNEVGAVIVQYLLYDPDGDACGATVEYDAGGGQFVTGTCPSDRGGDGTSRLEASLQEERDDSGQLSLWQLTGVQLGTNTDATGRLYGKLEWNGLSSEYEVSLYSDAALSNLVAFGGRADDGWVTLSERNSSGISGGVLLSYSADDSNIVLLCGAIHYVLWDTAADIGSQFMAQVAVQLVPSDSKDAGAASTQLVVDVDNRSGLFGASGVSLPSYQTNAAAAADFDSDGRCDAALACNDRVRVVLFEAGGTFSEKTFSARGPFHSVATADFDADAAPDIAACGDRGASVWLNDLAGSGDFTRVTLTGVPGPAWATGAADVNLDGDIDVVVATRSGVFLCLNDGAGGFEDAVKISGYEARALAFVDLDGDLYPDVYLARQEADVLLLSDGAGGFSESAGALPGAARNTRGVLALDADSDGDTDVLLLRDAGNVLLTNASGVFSAPSNRIPDIKRKTYSAAALTRSGGVYVALACYGHDLLWRLWNGRLFDMTALNLTAGGGVSTGAAAGDFDGDGVPDVYLGCYGADTLLLGR